jgi:Na+-translocating ferredoxin:NAD+ oxidoreductase subunit B
MTIDVYEALAKHLDNLPTGFPRTENGTEMRILRRLFTPEDAELAVHLTILPEAPRVIARRAGISVTEATRRLEEMDKKGLVMSVQGEGMARRYMAVQFVPGFQEAQVNRLTAELWADIDEYASTFVHPERWRKAPIQRVIPIQKSLSVQNEVMSYEMAEELMGSHSSRAVMNCICRQGMRVLGKGCDKTEESCITLGPGADYMVHAGSARRIDLEEGLDILKRADEEGLVLQPDNAKDPFFMCTCCGCCCGVLRNIKRDPKPGRIVSSPFHARLDAAECNGCGLCAKRCTMDAIRVVEKKVVLDVDRCIGCGLCVSKCPTHAMSLERKPRAEQAEVPEDHMKGQIKIAQAHGKLGIGELMKLQLKSKLDRMLAMNRK